jgi:hypothetical protein
VGGRGEIDGKHHFEVTTLIGTISWTFKRTSKMKGRIVDELDIDIRRPVIVAALESSNQSQSDGAHKKINSASVVRAISLIIRRYSTSGMRKSAERR